MQNKLFPSQAEIDAQADELQAKFDLTDDELKNALAWVSEEDDLDAGVEEKLYSWYLNSGEMPYGVAKARTGDPQLWILERLKHDLGLDWVR